MNGENDTSVTLRSWKPCDAHDCRTLYHDGLKLGPTGEIPTSDTGIDIDDIETAYMKEAGNHFWVAVNKENEVVGMIGVQHHEAGVGEIRRLRVRPDHRRRGIGSRLLEAAIKFCHDNGHLKITLDTFVERAPAIKLFEKFSFRHNRTRTVNNKELLYFYLDIYGQNRPTRSS